MTAIAQSWLIFASVVSGGLLVYWLAPVLTPFLAAAILAYLGDPLVDRLQAYRLSRTLGVVIVFVLLFLVLGIGLLLLIPALESQLRALLVRFPEYLAWLQTQLLPYLRDHLGVEISGLDWESLKQSLQEHGAQVGGFAKGFIVWVTQSGLTLALWVTNLVLIPVVTFYLLRDWDHLLATLHDMIPRQWEPVTTRLAREADTVLGAFLRGQLLVMLALAVIYSIGLWLVGLELALIIGLIAGLASFVPYLGFILGILLAGVAALVQFQEWQPLLLVALVFGIGQMLESMLLTPWLVGDKIGLHPVAVMFAVMAGGQLFGFVGILLALPVAAVLVVLLRELHRRYRHSGFYVDTRPEE